MIKNIFLVVFLAYSTVQAKIIVLPDLSKAEACNADFSSEKFQCVDAQSNVLFSSYSILGTPQDKGLGLIVQMKNLGFELKSVDSYNSYYFVRN